MIPSLYLSLRVWFHSTCLIWWPACDLSSPPPQFLGKVESNLTLVLRGRAFGIWLGLEKAIVKPVYRRGRERQGISQEPPQPHHVSSTSLRHCLAHPAFHSVCQVMEEGPSCKVSDPGQHQCSSSLTWWLAGVLLCFVVIFPLFLVCLSSKNLSI